MESHRLLLAVTVFGAMLFVLAFSKPSITGFVPTATYTQDLDITVSQSQRFYLDSPAGESLELSSLALSGRVSGYGLVNVYLSNGAQRFLVYSNKETRSSAMQHITGLAVDELRVVPGETLDVIETTSGEFDTTTGAFQFACVETCTMNANLGAQAYLDVIVEPGASVTLSELRFTIPQ